MSVGQVRWYDSLKGYGYILSPNGEEIYFHQSSLRELCEMRQGSLVHYDLIHTRMGLEATNVRVP